MSFRKGAPEISIVFFKERAVGLTWPRSAKRKNTYLQLAARNSQNDGSRIARPLLEYPMRFETMPSRSIQHACRKMWPHLR